jgi:hypothetical protein
MTARRGLAFIAGAVAILLVVWARRGPDRLPSAHADPAMALAARAIVPPDVSDLLRRACNDCHSQETVWPWYARVPGSGWLVTRDVEHGRRQMNFSRWGEYNPYDRADMLDKICERATRHEMPLRPYTWLHADARLNDADVAALCRWTDAEAARLVNGGT